MLFFPLFFVFQSRIHSRDVVLEHVQGLSHFPHIKHVAVVVLICLFAVNFPFLQQVPKIASTHHCKVEGLHWVPRNRVGPHIEHQLGQGRLGADIVQDNVAVTATAGEHVCLCLVEADGIDRVCAPHKRVDRLRPFFFLVKRMSVNKRRP